MRRQPETPEVRVYHTGAICQVWNVNLTSVAQESAWIHVCKGSALSLTGTASLGIGEKQLEPKLTHSFIQTT